MDERYDLLGGKVQEDADATRERPHISLNVELAQPGIVKLCYQMVAANLLLFIK